MLQVHINQKIHGTLLTLQEQYLLQVVQTVVLWVTVLYKLTDVQIQQHLTMTH